MVAEFSWVGEALQQLSTILSRKGTDYSNRGEFGNFEEQARIAGVSVRQVFRGAIGQKMTREMTMHENGGAVNESQFDTILDTAGYAVLWLAYTIMMESPKA